MKWILIIITGLFIINTLEASGKKVSKADVQTDLHYKKVKNAKGGDDIILNNVEKCDPEEETHMPFYY